MGNVETPAGAVEVDKAALLAEADQLAALDTAAPGAAPVPGEVTGEVMPADPGQRAAQLQPAVTLAVSELSNFIAPNWRVTREESEQVGGSLSLVLAYWMPDSSIEPKYVALASLAAALWGVAAARRDPETGQFKPLRAEPEKRETVAPQSPGPVPLSL